MALSRVLATFAAGYTIFLLLRWKKRVKQMPPGPPKLPVVDNLFNMPTELDARKFTKLGKELDSEILHFGALGTDIVVLNSYRVAQELLDKRSGIYSDRPSLPMYNLCGWNFQFTTWEYGDRWRRARKLFTKWFSETAMLHPREDFYIRRLLKQLLQHPEAFFAQIRHLPGAITLDITYGIKVQSLDDPYISLAEAGALEGTSLFVGGPHLVDLFPMLRYLPEWMPGAGFKKKAACSRDLAHRVQQTAFDASRKMMEDGRYDLSFVTDALEDPEFEKDPDFVKMVAGAVYLAGSDTTTAALGTLFYAMAIHPEIQHKVQEELDAVLLGRLPNHEDLEALPYFTAVIFEILRWRPITPIGVSHSVIMEDVFEGYLIPKGAVVAPNQLAMLYDERDYPEPEKFKPERFLKDGQLDQSVRSPLDIGFGFGRRICPGRHIAQSILMLTAASILSTFNITKSKDSEGNVIDPKAQYEGFLVSQPLEFPCDVKPRSPRAVELISSL